MNFFEDLTRRPRRNRVNASIRNMVRETHLTPSDFVLPLFIKEGKGAKEAIASMPNVFRLGPDLAVAAAKEAYRAGIPAIVLFPALEDSIKDPFAKESTNPNGLLQRVIADIKSAVPELNLISDVAMDPYSSDGHDGLVKDGEILNDETLEILALMAISQAKAGVDIIAPSDMMDGRVAYLRRALDQNGFHKVGILSYTAKYASALYGPFRDALESAPKSGDKKTYQMDPANSREALVELELDLAEGADIVMVKPAMAYLDIIAKIKAACNIPVAAYHVSGEYAMIHAAHEKGWLDGPKVMEEHMLSIKRAGADIIFTYAALDLAKRLNA